jgi:DNA repair protein RecO (recombination protein O)
MKHNLRTRGLVLARQNIGEADRLMTVFTENYGKVKVIARGARKIKSKLAPHIEPFQLIDLEYIEGKTFYILTGAERKAPKTESFRDLDNFRIISYLYEITDLAFQEKEPNKAIFRLLAEITENYVHLSRDKENIVCRYYEFRLLSELGFRPDYYHCVKCGQKITEHKDYKGSFEGVLCEHCHGNGKRISKEALKSLRFIAGNDLGQILKIKQADSLSAELESFISPFLCEVLPRQPRSLKL